MDKENQTEKFQQRLDQLVLQVPSHQLDSDNDRAIRAIKQRGFGSSLELLFAEYPEGKSIMDELRKFGEADFGIYVLSNFAYLPLDKKAEDVGIAAKELGKEETVLAAARVGKLFVDAIFPFLSAGRTEILSDICKAFTAYKGREEFQSLYQLLRYISWGPFPPGSDTAKAILQEFYSKEMLDTLDSYNGIKYGREMKENLFKKISQTRSIARLKRLREALGDEQVILAAKDSQGSLDESIAMIYSGIIEMFPDPETILRIGRTYCGLKNRKEKAKFACDLTNTLLRTPDPYEADAFCERYSKK